MWGGWSDDKSEVNSVHDYTVAIDLAGDPIEDGDVTFLSATTQKDKKVKLYAEDALATEDIDLVRPGQQRPFYC